MADITMCKGTGCKFKQQCYRFRAIPGKYQSYFSVVPYDPKAKHCNYISPILEGDILRKKTRRT